MIDIFLGQERQTVRGVNLYERDEEKRDESMIVDKRCCPFIGHRTVDAGFRGSTVELLPSLDPYDRL